MEAEREIKEEAPGSEVVIVAVALQERSLKLLLFKSWFCHIHLR